MVGFLPERPMQLKRGQAQAEPYQRRLTLSQPQMEAWQAPEAQIAAVAGIRGGKTFFGREFIVDRARRFPDAYHMALANSYTQLERVTVPEITKCLKSWHLPFVYKRGDRAFEFQTSKGTSTIWLQSTDNIDLARGIELGTAWLDELRDAPPGTYKLILGRLSSPHVDVPRVLVTTTPNGFDQVHDYFADKAIPGERAMYTWRTRDNPFLRPDYVRAMYRDYDPETKDQELDAKFIALGQGSVFKWFSRHRNQRTSKVNPGRRLWVSIDFNIGVMGWIIAQQREDGTLDVVDEITGRDATIRDGVRMLAEKYGDHHGGFDIIGDTTNQRNRETGKADWDVLDEELRQSGLRDVRTHVQIYFNNPSVKGTVQEVNRCFLDAEGGTRLYLNPGSTDELRRDLEQMTWKNGKPDKSDDARSHWSDALRYLVHHLYPVQGGAFQSRSAFT